MTATLDQVRARLEPWAWDALVALFAALAGIVVALIVHRMIFSLLKRLARHNQASSDDIVLAALERPAGWALGALGLMLAARTTATLAALEARFAGPLMAVLLGWIAFALVRGLADAMAQRAELSSDIGTARSRRTRIALLSRTVLMVIVVVTIGLVLFHIPGVRDIGVTLMASAGLAALAVGAAAQPALKSLIAGLQMAITEPLRIGDLVVVDGYTGRVEEMRLSFVSVRTWDERLVLVPTARFFEQSFENWSRRTEMLTGPVYLHLNPASEIAPIRAEFLRFLATRAEWDQRTGALLVTEARAETAELRLAMSAATIGELFDLRCAVREHMLDWLRREMPDALIRHRLDAEAADARATD